MTEHNNSILFFVEVQPETNPMLKYVSLVLLSVQNTLLILIMRYVRTQEGDMFMATTAVIMSETFKVLASLLIILYQEGSMTKWAQHLVDNIIKQPVDCIKVSVPSVIYVLQNNLLYVAVSNLDAATYQVFFMILFTKHTGITSKDNKFNVKWLCNRNVELIKLQSFTFLIIIWNILQNMFKDHPFTFSMTLEKGPL